MVCKLYKKYLKEMLVCNFPYLLAKLLIDILSCSATFIISDTLSKVMNRKAFIPFLLSPLPTKSLDN